MQPVANGRGGAAGRASVRGVLSAEVPGACGHFPVPAEAVVQTGKREREREILSLYILFWRNLSLFFFIFS